MNQKFTAIDHQTVTRRSIFLVAWPIILSNVSTPLLGLVDTAVVGNLGDAALLGGIAVGAMIFSFLFWGFGFLRMGTTALVSQASGAGDADEVVATTGRAVCLALGIGVVLLLLQYPVSLMAFSFIDGSQEVESAAATYFQIRIWSAPLTMLNMVILGYFLGHQRSGTVLLIQLLLNGTNILLDLVFVLGFGWGVEGVALATVCAELAAAITGSLLLYYHLMAKVGRISVNMQSLTNSSALLRTLAVNRDIMIRTLCLIFAFAFFTNEGAAAGDTVLAANAILMQFVSFSAFFLDGFALAGESLVGRAVGGDSRANLLATIRYTHELGLATAVALMALFTLSGPWVIDLLTNVPEVRVAANVYLLWAIAAPLTSLWCYMLDGIFIGATCTVEMRNAMFLSLASFLLAWSVLTPAFSNHGLWLSLHIYFIARAVFLAMYLPRVYGRVSSALH